MGRRGVPVSLKAPVVSVWFETPIFSIRPDTFTPPKITPMEPVTVVG
jgi:hypothetical protein